MIRFDKRDQYFTLDHPFVDEIGIYDATPEGIPSVIFFKGKRASKKLIEEFAFCANEYEPCYGYGPITVGIVEDFLAQYVTTKVDKYRGRSEA